MEEDSFYISLKDTLKNRLIKDLIKDEEFKDLDIEDLIKRTVEKKLNEDIDFNVKKSKKNNSNSEEKEYIKQAMKMNKKIEFINENYKHKDSTAYERYERYKKSTNYEEFIRLGGNNGDYYNDFRKDYLKILD